MHAKEKKSKSMTGPLSKEEWVVRYDILKHSLWIVAKCLSLLCFIWYVVFLIDGYDQWLRMLVKVMAVPVLIACLAVLFESCFGKYQWPLSDGIVLLILNFIMVLVLAGNQWSHSLQFFCVLPIVFFMILGNIKLVYVQVALSVAMVIIHFFLIEINTSLRWKSDVILNLSGVVFNLIVIARVIVQIRKYAQMLGTQITIDSLTRLHNHEAFYEELDSKLAGYNGEMPLSILIADIDNFKKVNDNFGHAYGDKVLKALAGIFSEEESKKCFASRYGGEEFAMIMDMNQADALTKAQTIRKHFEQMQIPTENGDIKSFTISIGVAVYQPEYQTSSQFFEKADEALYKAKAGGKNRVCIY